MPMFTVPTSLRRSNLSATAPAGKPSRKKGTILSPSTTPTMKVSSVRTWVTQPSTTISPTNPQLLKAVESHSSLNPRYRRAGVLSIFERADLAPETEVCSAIYHLRARRRWHR